jgi:hypothetical protein
MLAPSAGARKHGARQVRVCADSKASGNGGTRAAGAPDSMKEPLVPRDWRVASPCQGDERFGANAPTGRQAPGYRWATDDPSTFPSMMSRAY